MLMLIGGIASRPGASLKQLSTMSTTGGFPGAFAAVRSAVAISASLSLPGKRELILLEGNVRRIGALAVGTDGNVYLALSLERRRQRPHVNLVQAHVLSLGA